MAKLYDVRVRILSQTDTCPNGHQVGEAWRIGRKTPAGICLGAFSTLLPYITTLRCGGDFPWEEQAGRGTFGCPDHERCQVFSLERIEA